MNAQLKPLFAAVLVASQFGCSLASTQTPSDQVRASLGTIGVVADAEAPTIQLPESLTHQSQGRTTAQAAGQGAKGALAGGLLGGLAGALIGSLIGLAVCAPAGLAAPICAGAMFVYGAAGGAGTGALAGGTYAAMKAPATESQASDVSSATLDELLHDTIRAHIDSPDLKRSLSEQLAATARRKTDRAIIVLQDGWNGIPAGGPGEPATIDTALELKIDMLRLVADQTGTANLAKAYMKTAATLVRVADRRELYSSEFEYSSAARALEDWSSEISWQEFIADAIPWLAEAIVDQLFVTVPAAPPDWLLAVKNPLVKTRETLRSWFADKRPQAESSTVENGAP